MGHREGHFTQSLERIHRAHCKSKITFFHKRPSLIPIHRSPKQNGTKHTSTRSRRRRKKKELTKHRKIQTFFPTAVGTSVWDVLSQSQHAHHYSLHGIQIETGARPDLLCVSFLLSKQTRLPPCEAAQETSLAQEPQASDEAYKG